MIAALIVLWIVMFFVVFLYIHLKLVEGKPEGEDIFMAMFLGLIWPITMLYLGFAALADLCYIIRKAKDKLE